MDFQPTEMCDFCELEIMLVDGRWVDQTIEHPEVDVSFAAVCGEGSEFHQPMSRS